MLTQTMRDAARGTAHEQQIATLANIIETGRGYQIGYAIYLNNLTDDEQGVMLGLAARYPENITALVTHDLNSATVNRIGDLISEIRIGN